MKALFGMSDGSCGSMMVPSLLLFKFFGTGGGTAANTASSHFLSKGNKGDQLDSVEELVVISNNLNLNENRSLDISLECTLL